jgi:hypothetical protein
VEHDINPGHIYRLSEGPSIFGFSRAQIDRLIRSGGIPAPTQLSMGGKDGKRPRAKGWTGRQIIDHRARLRAESEKQEKTEKRAAKRAEAAA